MAKHSSNKHDYNMISIPSYLQVNRGVSVEIENIRFNCSLTIIVVRWKEPYRQENIVFLYNQSYLQS